MAETARSSNLAWVAVAVLGALLLASLGLNAYFAYGLADAAATIKGCHSANEDCSFHRDGLDRAVQGVSRETFERAAGKAFVEGVFLGFTDDGKYRCSAYRSSESPLFVRVADVADGKEVAVCR